MSLLQTNKSIEEWMTLANRQDIDFKAHGRFRDKGLTPEDIFAQINHPIPHQKEFSSDIFTLDTGASIRFKKSKLNKIHVDYFDPSGPRYLINFGYRGTLFQGTQRQKNPVRTVQGELENVLTHIYQSPVEITPASRTDRGVHAFHNYAHFDPPEGKDIKDLAMIVKRMIPEDIIIHDITLVSSIFHARYDALSKTYQYFLKSDLDVKFMHSAWAVPGIDINEVKEKLKIFEGVHDFKNFSKYRDFSSTIRSIESLRLFQEDDVWVLEFQGPSFLRYMIRMMVGALIHYDASTIQKGLKYPDQSIGKHIAPSHGLYLVDIDY